MIVAAAAWVLYRILFLIPVNADNSWLLVACERILDGQRLNIDFVEVNPPFSIWLYMPFVLVERFIGVPAEEVMFAGIIAWTLGALAVSSLILLRADLAYHKPRYAWALPIAFLIVVGMMPAEFGEREQFALIAMLPWLALHCARVRSIDFVAGTKAEKLLAGLCAAIVVMVKPPYFVLALLVPSAVEAARRRSLRPLFTSENITGAIITLGYLVSIILFDQRYLTEIMPLIEQLYLPESKSFLALLLGFPLLYSLIGMAMVPRAEEDGAIGGDARRLLLAGSGFIPGFLIMGKGWPNHALPFFLLAVLGFILQVLATRRYTVTRFTAVLMGALLIAPIIALLQLRALDPGASLLSARVAATKAVIDHPTVASISPRLQTGFPFSRLVGGRFVSRFPSTWAIDNADALMHKSSGPVEKERLRKVRDRLDIRPRGGTCGQETADPGGDAAVGRLHAEGSSEKSGHECGASAL